MGERHLQIIVNLKRIETNIQAIRNVVEKHVKICPVVKADAYGHGAIHVAKTIEKLVDMLAVATVGEGVELVNHGIKKPVVVMGGFNPSEAQEIVHYRLIPFIFENYQIKALSQEAARHNTSVKVFLKFDSGMGRLGFDPEKASLLMQTFSENRVLELHGIASHFAYSDLGCMDTIQEQIRIFSHIKNIFSRCSSVQFFSLANSAGTIYLSESHFNMVRPGLAIYGINPVPARKSPLKLQPALSMETRILSIRKMPAGRGISYSHTFVTRRDSLIGIIAGGYADGIWRALSNRGEVLVKGKRCPIVGNVCMDLTMIDLTENPRAKIGDRVVIIGEDGEETITADEVANHAGTISYEVLASLSRRATRTWIQ